MRILILSKALIVGQYQTKLTALAALPDVELTVVAPPYWRDERGTITLEKQHTSGYELVVAPMRWNGHFHVHYYPTLPEVLERVAPDLVHIDEEPYNLATLRAVRATRRLVPGARTLFFSWQNILRRYPPPFRWMEQWVYSSVDGAIAGTAEARANLIRKGYHGPLRVIPQFGVTPAFHPEPHAPSSTLVIGYAGRFVHEKGIQVLLGALARVPGKWELRVLGSGPLYAALGQLAHQLGIADQVRFAPWTTSDEMPRFYNALDLLVVPSLTKPNWKEQFGRAIMEGMACGIPVVGSDSGEIPNVIGDAGIIVREGDVDALARALSELLQDPARRRALADQGRARALTLFSQERVVADTYAFYCELLSGRGSRRGKF